MMKDIRCLKTIKKETQSPKINLQINVCIEVDGNNSKDVFSYINTNSWEFDQYAKISFKKIVKNIASNFNNSNKKRINANLGVRLFNENKGWNTEIVNIKLNE